jgi:hypothetical protein
MSPSHSWRLQLVGLVPFLRERLPALPFKLVVVVGKSLKRDCCYNIHFLFLFVALLQLEELALLAPRPSIRRTARVSLWSAIIQAQVRVPQVPAPSSKTLLDLGA